MRGAIVYLGALIALPVIIVGMGIVAPFILLTVLLEKIGLKAAPPRPNCGCVRCAQKAKRSPHAAGTVTGHALAQRVSPAAASNDARIA